MKRLLIFFYIFLFFFYKQGLAQSQSIAIEVSPTYNPNNYNQVNDSSIMDLLPGVVNNSYGFSPLDSKSIINEKKFVVPPDFSSTGDPVDRLIHGIHNNAGFSASPSITPGKVTGNIVACLGVVSVAPYIQQFTVSGVNLTDVIMAAVTVGFEISLDPNNGYSNNLTIPRNGGVVNTTVYVRASATSTAGNLTGIVTLTSPGVKTSASVTGRVNTLPVIGAVLNQIYKNGETTSGVNFDTNGNTVTWTNDTPGIGTAASGSGNIPSFTAINTSAGPVTAHFIAIPTYPVTGCTGTPVPFSITVESTLPPVIKTVGNLPPLNTIYGTPSTATIFTTSATDLTANILVTPPSGFEVSTDDQTFNATVSIAGTAGTVASTEVYIRLAATTPVGNYSGNIVITSAGAASVVIAMPLSTVIPAPLTITANNKTKLYGTVNPPLTVSYTGLVNNDTPGSLTSAPILSTIAVTSSPVGQYPITVNGAESPNYTITYVSGVLSIVIPPPQVVIPNAFTPNGDGINDTWAIKNIDYYLNCSVYIYNRYGEKVYSSIGYGIPWDGTYKGTNLPFGTYYYIVDLKNGFKALSGFVAIIR